MLTAAIPAIPALDRLRAGHSLSSIEAEEIFIELVEGHLSDAVVADLLLALSHKGETASELIGAARALRAADADFPRPDYLFADCCGTGGDGAGTINLSTAAAFVAASCGLPVAKHGNRSITSRCGSADVLEALGARIDIAPAASRRVLDETGICFLFAPLYHPGLRHAAAARRMVGTRTIMNALGPCLNPAEPPIQLLGVADPQLLMPVAETLSALGVGWGLVVHGDELDEVALHGPTQAVRIDRGRLEPMTITPADAGFRARPMAALKGGDATANAARLKALLAGGGTLEEQQATALNAGALLMIAGLAGTLRDGAALAMDSLAAGAPAKTLAAFVEASHA